MYVVKEKKVDNAKINTLLLSIGCKPIRRVTKTIMEFGNQCFNYYDVGVNYHDAIVITW